MANKISDIIHHPTDTTVGYATPPKAKGGINHRGNTVGLRISATNDGRYDTHFPTTDATAFANHCVRNKSSVAQLKHVLLPSDNVATRCSNALLFVRIDTCFALLQHTLASSEQIARYYPHPDGYTHREIRLMDAALIDQARKQIQQVMTSIDSVNILSALISAMTLIKQYQKDASILRALGKISQANYKKIFTRATDITHSLSKLGAVYKRPMRC